MTESLVSLRHAHPVISTIVVASVIKDGEWYLQESLMMCPCGCAYSAAYKLLLVSEARAVEAMQLWPETPIRRNEVFKWVPTP